MYWCVTHQKTLIESFFFFGSSFSIFIHLMVILVGFLSIYIFIYILAKMQITPLKFWGSLNSYLLKFQNLNFTLWNYCNYWIYQNKVVKYLFFILPNMSKVSYNFVIKIISINCSISNAILMHHFII